MNKLTIPLWIIAICETIRILQNAVHLFLDLRQSKEYSSAVAEFVESLNESDKDFVKKLNEEMYRQELKNNE